ncbi:hypothetical protein T4E_1544 [Trichinella pseudospiralis]|uniref:Uncharacterized protein n=1 Tax=Trichinella pseudospiralis TaxID=6337 RepID=A0A0V0YAI4_TRIPS|nr:hypothetical protein T4E_1544 [Trichinella pseudospiralis]
MWNADSPAWKYTSEPQMFCLSREQIWWNTTLSSILEEFRRDLRRMNLTGHALYTSVAKPVRCLPMRITHHQLIQVVTLLNSTANFTITELWCSSWASPIVLITGILCWLLKVDLWLKSLAELEFEVEH